VTHFRNANTDFGTWFALPTEAQIGTACADFSIWRDLSDAVVSSSGKYKPTEAQIRHAAADFST
jgi:hypothetical protein